MIKATHQLHDARQSVWLDDITRALLVGGGLERYIRELSVTGLTSNSTIYDQAIQQSQDYDAAIRQESQDGKSTDALVESWDDLLACLVEKSMALKKAG